MKLIKEVQNGIFFKCKKSGHCCSNLQEGYIFIYKEDLIKISSNLGLSQNEFAKKYLALTDYEFTIWDENLNDTKKQKILKILIFNFESGDTCFFYNNKKNNKNKNNKNNNNDNNYSNNEGECMIYNSRPIQCELFPFWNCLMESEKNFQKTKKNCLGFQALHTEENFYSAKKIKKLLKIERKVEFDYFQDMKKVNFNIYDMYPFLKEIDPLPNL